MRTARWCHAGGAALKWTARQQLYLSAGNFFNRAALTLLAKLEVNHARPCGLCTGHLFKLPFRRCVGTGHRFCAFFLDPSGAFKWHSDHGNRMCHCWRQSGLAGRALVADPNSAPACRLVLIGWPKSWPSQRLICTPSPHHRFRFNRSRQLVAPI